MEIAMIVSNKYHDNYLPYIVRKIFFLAFQKIKIQVFYRYTDQYFFSLTLKKTLKYFSLFDFLYAFFSHAFLCINI